MHPLGFSYYPDGAHANADELEPTIVPPGSSSTCDTDSSCPAPMYHMNEEYLGSYSNNVNISSEHISDNASEDFGLDNYEPMFFHPHLSGLDTETSPSTLSSMLIPTLRETSL